MMNVNYMGSMRLLDMSRKFKKFSVYNFVSSVGANLNSTLKFDKIEEKLYSDLPYKDPHKVILEIMALSHDEAQAKQS